jgi:hypothetical protein
LSMGGLRRHPLDGAASPVLRRGYPVPAGIRVLTNSCVERGAKVLTKDGWMVATLDIDDPPEGYDFDTVIVSACD